MTGKPEVDNIYTYKREPKRSSQPVFDWFLIALAILVPLDVAIRRIQIDVVAIWRAITLRRRAPVTATMGALLQAKQTVSATLKSKREDRPLPPQSGSVPPRSTSSKPSTSAAKSEEPAAPPAPPPAAGSPTSTTERLLAMKRKRDEQK